MSSITGSEDVAARVLDITGGVGVDHIAEVDFGGNLAAALRCLRVNGSIMIYATNGDREPKLPVRDLMQKNLAVYAMSLRRRAASRTAAGAVGHRGVDRDRRAASCRLRRAFRCTKPPPPTRPWSAAARSGRSWSSRSADPRFCYPPKKPLAKRTSVAGACRCGKCPASTITSNLAWGISAATCRPISGGQMKSSAPEATRTGARIAPQSAGVSSSRPSASDNSA